MIPLIPALALAFFSFICSAIVVLRIIVPILPPHPLSRRVSPSEFGLPNYRSLSPADQSHLWLACLDVVAVGFFCWQVVAEATGGVSGAQAAQEPAASVRLWIITTLRQTCLLVIVSLTLLHVRMGRSVSFGSKQWMLWAPMAVLVITSTALAGVLPGAGVPSLFVGLTAYTTAVAGLSSVAICCLVGTLIAIKRNLSMSHDELDNWPPVTRNEEKPRPSFATEDIDAIRDGASWITSRASSRHDSISAWSFSTHHTTVPSQHGHGRPAHSSVPAKSSFWFGDATNEENVPPVPPLPAPYGPSQLSPDSLSDPDPFRRTTPSPGYESQRPRLGSQTSWLTSTDGTQPTVSAWSFPTTYAASAYNASSPNVNTELLPATTAVSRPATPALADARVLGGYGYSPSASPTHMEKGLDAFATSSDTPLDISVYQALGWLLLIWVPLALAYPFLCTALQGNTISTPMSITFILSVTLSSPALLLNILLRSPLPVPWGLFDSPSNLPSNVLSEKQRHGSVPPAKWSHSYKQSTTASVTVVEGRRSGDVWVAKGDAVEGKGKMSRAFSMMARAPKLSVLPVEGTDDDLAPIPIHDGDSSIPITVHNTPQSETSAQFGRIRKESKASSRLSHVDESLAYASRIMVAQRHYSTLAQTVHIAPSPERDAAKIGHVAKGSASGISGHAGHLRARSVSSIDGPKASADMDSRNISPPPSFPLPPTPPNVRAARLAKHKKSYSSGFSFGPVDDVNEIDALTAGVLPLLVPGLKVGQDMKIVDGDYTPPGTWSKSKAGKRAARLLAEFGGDFSSPEIHSTPARTKTPRHRKTPQHKRAHMSLPSLGLGKDEVHSFTQWGMDVGRALESLGQYTALPTNADLALRRYTVYGGESSPSRVTPLRTVAENVQDSQRTSQGLSRALSTRSLGLRADVPHGLETARNSVVTINGIPPLSAASTATLFEELEAGLNAGPLAESTPHNSVNHKRMSEDVPPMPIIPQHVSNVRKEHRRSSIVYIKSDDAPTVTPPNAATTSMMSSFAQWSTRAVRPLMPKSSKVQRKTSKNDSPDGKENSPKGLRPLSLLQDRNANQDSTSSVGKSTRPLLLGKKKSRILRSSQQDENAPAGPPQSKKGLRQLQLARSETSKMRGVLRQEEALPNVVVRSPSNAEHNAYSYSSRA